MESNSVQVSGIRHGIFVGLIFHPLGFFWGGGLVESFREKEGH